MTPALRIRPPAKVNLWLRVLGRRADGYHELDTVFHALDLADELVGIRTERIGAVELTVDDRAGSGLPVAVGDDNLVVRAARAVLAAGEARCGLRFHLAKQIPAGGGLGGGSSDAAAALRLAAALAGVALSPRKMRELALACGADVPFFLVGGTCRGGGVGERLVPLSDPARYGFLLVIPPFGTSTAAVFREMGMRCEAGAKDRKIGPPHPGSAADSLDRPGANDLMDPALRCHPELGALVARLDALGVAGVRMSGSGSTLFVAERLDPGDGGATERRLGALAARIGPALAESGTRVLRCRSGPRTIRMEESSWPFGGSNVGRGESP